MSDSDRTVVAETGKRRVAKRGTPDQRKSWARIAAVVLITLAAVLVVRMVGVVLDTRRARQTEVELAADVAALERDVEALQTGAAEASSDESVERWAREQMGWVREGDHPIAVSVTPEAPAPEAAEGQDDRSVLERLADWLSSALRLGD